MTERGSLFQFREGDRCKMCLHWFWERGPLSNDRGWHSLIPITLADHPELAEYVVCPFCNEDPA